ncbi:MAG TPA: hypothetical protein VGM19_14510 [Armatimonadota bacterium]|jgi:hypothetical protein
MRRTTLTVAAAVLMLTVWAIAASAVTLVFEGENYTWIKPSMKVAGSDDTASGGKYVYIPMRSNHGQTEQGPADAGNVTYKVYIPTEGYYTVWARTKWFDGCGNSFFYYMDNFSPEAARVIEDSTYQKWHWVKGRAFKLTVGYHQVRFQYREDASKLDQFLVTTADEWTPTGKMSETSRYLWRP